MCFFLGSLFDNVCVTACFMTRFLPQCRNQQQSAEEGEKELFSFLFIFDKPFSSL